MAVEGRFYRIVKAYSFKALAGELDDMLSGGWQLHGAAVQEGAEWLQGVYRMPTRQPPPPYDQQPPGPRNR